MRRLTRGSIMAAAAGVVLACSCMVTPAYAAPEKVESAEEFVAAVQNASVEEITLGADIDLTQAITINRNVVINGGDHTLTNSFDGSAAGEDNALNVYGDVDVKISDLTIVDKNGGNVLTALERADITLDDVTLDHSQSSDGAALIVNDGSTVTMSGCSIKLGAGSWGGVAMEDNGSKVTLGNPTVSGDAGKALVYVDTKGADITQYVTDADAYLKGAITDGNNKPAVSSKVWTVSSQDELQTAVANAPAGMTIALGNDITVSGSGIYAGGKENLTIDGNGHALNASGLVNGGAGAAAGRSALTFDNSTGTVQDITVNNGTSDVANNGLNFSGAATKFTVRNVVLNHATAGAPMIVAAGSKVTVEGSFEATLGESSWGVANVEDAGTSLAFAEGVNATLNTNGKPAVYADPDAGIKVSDVVSGAENAGLALSPDGTVVSPVAYIGDAAYGSLESALANVKDGQTITLVADAVASESLILTANNVTIDGAGFRITAGSNFQVTDSNGGTGHGTLLTILGNGCTVKNAELVGTQSTTHVINAWNNAKAAATLSLENVTLNHSVAQKGAALVVNHVDVTVSGNFNVIAGVNSWGGVNLDNKYGETSLVLAEDAAPNFNNVSGKDLPFIWVENTGKVVEGMPEVVNNSSMGLTSEDGTFSLHEHVIEIRGYVEPTTTTEGYTGDQYCTVCGELIAKGEVIPCIEPGDVVMFRLYNRWTGEHFYTSNTVERDSIIEAGWSYEGVGWIAPGKGAPVYRLYNPYVEGGDHHYTMSAEERDALVEVGWSYEGVSWYSADKETGVPVLRQYNPFASSGTHNYTVSEEERDNLVSLGWKDEGIGWYALDTEAK